MAGRWSGDLRDSADALGYVRQANRVGAPRMMLSKAQLRNDQRTVLQSVPAGGSQMLSKFAVLSLALVGWTTCSAFGPDVDFTAECICAGPSHQISANGIITPQNRPFLLDLTLRKGTQREYRSVQVFAGTCTREQCAASHVGGEVNFAPIPGPVRLHSYFMVGRQDHPMGDEYILRGEGDGSLPGTEQAQLGSTSTAASASGCPQGYAQAYSDASGLYCKSSTSAASVCPGQSFVYTCGPLGNQCCQVNADNPCMAGWYPATPPGVASGGIYGTGKHECKQRQR
jgi:hypothetical protein